MVNLAIFYFEFILLWNLLASNFHTLGIQGFNFFIFICLPFLQDSNCTYFELLDIVHLVCFFLFQSLSFPYFILYSFSIDFFPISFNLLLNSSNVLSSQILNFLTFRSYISVQFSCSVVSYSLWPHRPQHARPPCPSPTPRVYSNSCPPSQWCHPIISCCHPLLLLPSVFPSILFIMVGHFYTTFLNMWRIYVLF